MLDSLTPVPGVPSQPAYRWEDEGKRFVQEPRKSAPGLELAIDLGVPRRCLADRVSARSPGVGSGAWPQLPRH